jgi:hypothetical protein
MCESPEKQGNSYDVEGRSAGGAAFTTATVLLDGVGAESISIALPPTPDNVLGTPDSAVLPTLPRVSSRFVRRLDPPLDSSTFVPRWEGTVLDRLTLPPPPDSVVTGDSEPMDPGSVVSGPRFVPGSWNERRRASEPVVGSRRRSTSLYPPGGGSWLAYD